MYEQWLFKGKVVGLWGLMRATIVINFEFCTCGPYSKFKF